MLQILKNIVLSLYYTISSGSYRKIKRCAWFDAEFYRMDNPDLAESGIDPLLHYFTRGARELRSPSLLFDIRYYLHQVPELHEGRYDPLVHFLDGGWSLGLSPNCFFGNRWYKTCNWGRDFYSVDPLSHYLEDEQVSCPSPYFDATYYCNEYGDVASSLVHPLIHYLKVGKREWRRPSLSFDVEYYLDKTPILRQGEMDPLSHYLYFGIQEHKSPSPLFDPVYYEERYYLKSGSDPFLHYWEFGMAKDHRPCKWFDPVFYRDKYMATIPLQISPFEHYLTTGLSRGAYPSKDVFDLADKPLISLLVPVYNVSPAHLNNCIRSVLYQSYPHWELCLVDDCSSREGVRSLLKQWAGRDSRIKVQFLDENLGISGASNAAAALASGRYLGFLDNDDELDSDCLYTVVRAINRDTADLYYSDEDLIGEDGHQFSTFWKPNFNEQLLLSHNYITHFVVSSRELFDKVGGLDSDLDGAQDFDFFLKCSEQAGKIVHIPEILYHWRASQSSTSINHDQKSYADEAGRKAVSNALRRRGSRDMVTLTDWKFYYQIQKVPGELPPVSILILYRQDQGFEEWFVELLSQTKYEKIEFVLIGESEQLMLPFQGLAESCGCHLSLLVALPDMSVAARYNLAVRQSTGHYIVFLCPWVQLLANNWLEGLLGYAMENNIGLVGGRIEPFQGHEFVTEVPEIDEHSSLYYARFLQRCSQHMNGLGCVQNVLSLSWDLAMVRRESFLELDGFCEGPIGNLFADSDLCLRMGALGYEHIYTPWVRGRWLLPEEKQAMSKWTEDRAQKKVFQGKWHDLLRGGDPYYNRGLLSQHPIGQDEFLTWYAGEYRQEGGLVDLDPIQ